MKRYMFVLLMALMLAFAATPAFADDGKGDHTCIGGSTVVRGDETPNNVLLFGCGARIEKGAKVARDVVSFGGDVVIEEGVTIGHDVVSFGGDIDSAGQIGNDVFAFGGRITLQPTANVSHDVVTFGGGVERKEGATVQGQILRDGGSIPRVRLNPPVPPIAPTFRNWNFGGIVGDLIGGLFTTIGLAALGALIIVFMPNQLKQVGDVAQQSALPSLGVGCLTWLVVPPLMILFILTCLGIPLSAVLGILFIAAGVMGWVAVGMIVGQRVLDALKAQNIVPILAMVLGLLVLWLVTAIPFLGGLIWLFVASLAIGAVVLTRFGTRPYPMPVTSTSMVPAPLSQPTPPTPPATPTDSTPSA